MLPGRRSAPSPPEATLQEQCSEVKLGSSSSFSNSSSTHRDSETSTTSSEDAKEKQNANKSWRRGGWRTFLPFWLFGLCNNFSYVVMLSAAQDIIHKFDADHNKTSERGLCEEHLTSRGCTQLSTGAILVADIVPSLVFKLVSPFFIHYFPYGVRHLAVVALQMLSFLVVGLSWNEPVAIFGVILASASSGLGEVTYLGLASHFKANSIAGWSSGTGGAGIAGAGVYLLLTEPSLFHLSPSHALLSMLACSAIFAIVYWTSLRLPDSIPQASILLPKTWILKGNAAKSVTANSPEGTVKRKGPPPGFRLKMRAILSLMPYMIPISLVYFGEYFINQGLAELIVFDCSHGFRLSPASQYRFYQMLYQLGVFISRTSIRCVRLPMWIIAFLPVLQLANAVFFTTVALYYYVPHIGIVFAVILYEGFIGGASYANTFHHIHENVDESIREFALSVVSVADAIGITVAGFSAIPTHNAICQIPL